MRKKRRIHRLRPAPIAKVRTGTTALPTAMLQGYKETKHGNRLDLGGAIGAPRRPEGLDPEEAEIVDDVLMAMPHGVLGQLDTHGLRMMCDFHKVYRSAMAEWIKYPNNAKARISALAAFDRFLKLAYQFGFTPNARASMQRTEAADDTFDEILEKLST